MSTFIHISVAASMYASMHKSANMAITCLFTFLYNLLDTHLPLVLAFVLPLVFGRGKASARVKKAMPQTLHVRRRWHAKTGRHDPRWSV